METRQILDKNSLVEVYLHWLLDNNHEVDSVGHIEDFPKLGIYYVWNKKTNKYFLISSDYNVYKDKRIKKPLTRYKKSVTMFYTLDEEWQKLTDKSYEQVLRFLGMGDQESKIVFNETQDFGLIQEYLKKS
jgi:hypothetical protein